MRICPECRETTEARVCPNDGTATLDAAAFEPREDPLLGQIFDERYLVIEKIGKGGMGSVYRAKQLSVGREVALKVLKPELARDLDMAGRFVREAQVASRLHHPNTIVIHDFGHSKEGLFISMELLTGETLLSRLQRERPFPLGESLAIARAVAGSLGEAHQAGIVHRDMKPENIFLHRVRDLDVVKVLDFGIAKPFVEGGTAGRPDVYETAVKADGKRPVIGTYFYMAPEQISGKPIAAPADVFALGIILYEMVCGYRPFPSEEMIAVLRMHLQEEPMPMPTEVPDELQMLILRMLAKDPNERPANGDEVLRELDRVRELLRARGTRFTDQVTRRRVPTPATRNAPPTPSPRSKNASVQPMLWDWFRRRYQKRMRRFRAWRVRHQNTLRALLILMVVFAVVGGAAYLIRMNRLKKPETPAATTAPPEAEPVPDSPVEPSPEPVSPPEVAPSPEVSDSPALPPESARRAWRRVPAGTFSMGASGSGRRRDEGPVHSVLISRPMMVRATEVTQREWEALMKTTPSQRRACPECPVENVNWYEAVAFCNALSRHRKLPECYRTTGCEGRAGDGMRCATVDFKGTGCKGYRLPTEAEWEYIATGGGQDLPSLTEFAWYQDNTTEVMPGGKRAPGPWAIRDMLGNVWEWTTDLYRDDFYAWGGKTDPVVPGVSGARVTRGGGYPSPPSEVRPHIRRPREAYVLDGALGFRVVRAL